MSTVPTNNTRDQRPGSKGSRAAKKLLTVEEAAEELGMTTAFVRGLIKQRRIAYVKYGTARRSPVRIDRDVLASYIAEHTIEVSQ